MKTALFTNWTNEAFTGYWDGKARNYPAGKSEYMPDYLARHFAKHLTNRELLRRDDNGNLIYRNGDKMTSPKFPEQVPMFMDLFNKAYTPDETADDIGTPKDDVNSIITSAQKNRDKLKQEAAKVAGPAEPQTILPPDFNEDDEEEKFEGQPVESPANVDNSQ